MAHQCEIHPTLTDCIADELETASGLFWAARNAATQKEATPLWHAHHRTLNRIAELRDALRAATD